MPIESRSNSALFRRAEQLKRWEDSETNKISSDTPNDKKIKIKFSDGCVFLAACAAGDTEEVERLVNQGADINTANVDGLTALHQACIDDNLEMVQFLVEHGCDVNRGDNEGWTPLHATASCGFVSIAKYLIENGANVAAVNNDGDLPIDIAESPKMEELLSDILDDKGIDCDEARYQEEKVMIDDAYKWLNSQNYQDPIHPRTGATALHVAAAKGYIKVMNIQIKAGADLNAQDNDGWTPLHAAAHWGQKEACAVLADSLANMDIQNFSGQTCFDVAEPELMKLLEELKKKQASMQKDKPEIQAILQRTSTRPPLKRRTSVTRMSGQEKSKSVMKDTKSERAQIEQMALPEEEVEEERERKPNENIQRLLALRQGLKKLNEAAILRRSSDTETVPEKPPTPKEVQPEKIPSWKKMLRRSSDNLVEDSKVAEEPEVVLKKPKNIKSEENTSSDFKSPNEFTEDKNAHIECVFMKEPVRKKDISEPTEPSSLTEVTSDSQSQGKSRKFLPPLRDEESELQRKAHAKRVRETRRSTQGVLLEDIKTAELQHLIKATQEVSRALEKGDNNEKTACDGKEEQSLGRLSSSESTNKSSSDSKAEDKCNEKKSDELRNHTDLSLDTSPSVTLVLRPKSASNSDEQSSPDNRTSQATQAAIQRRRRPKRRSTGVVYLDSDDAVEDKEVSDKDKSHALSKEKNEDQKEDSPSASDRARHRYGSSAYQDVSSEASSRSETPSRYSSHSSNLHDDSDKDYKKLYQELKRENERLRDLEKENERLRNVEKENTQLRETLKQTQEELEKTKAQLKKLNEANNTRNAVNESEKRERRALERKLSEMEEEVKQMEILRAQNIKLKGENESLLRVISKVSQHKQNREWKGSSETAPSEVQLMN